MVVESDKRKTAHGADEEPALVERFNDPEWMQKALLELDEDLDSVTEELKKSYVRLAAGMEKLETELKTAFEAGDEMAYEAARIKKNMILERLRELEALGL